MKALHDIKAPINEDHILTAIGLHRVYPEMLFRIRDEHLQYAHGYTPHNWATLYDWRPWMNAGRRNPRRRDDALRQFRP